MYAEDEEFKYDKLRRSVLTWRHKNESDTKGIWEFTPAQKDSVFKIKNTHFNEYLYASKNYFKYDSERRRVFTWKRLGVKAYPKSSWFVRHESGNHFSLRNQAFKDYLYAAGDDYALDNDRRRVFNWTPGTREQEALWDIQC